MRNKGARLHHVVGLVRAASFEPAIARLTEVLETEFYPAVERPQHGIKMAISLDVGIELIAPLTDDPAHPLVQSLDGSGERWISVVIATDDLDAACDRLARLGHPTTGRQALMETSQPFADRIARFDQASFEPAAFAGLPIRLAQIEPLS